MTKTHIEYPIRAVDPPAFPPKRHRGRPSTWRPRLDALRPFPHDWFRFPGVNDAATNAHRINTGKIAGATPGEFEARTLNGELWVRYVGEERTLPTPQQAVDRIMDEWPAPLPEGLQDAIRAALLDYAP